MGIQSVTRSFSVGVGLLSSRLLLSVVSARGSVSFFSSSYYSSLSSKMTSIEEFDFAVIGGGSGGLSAAKEASRLGAKVVLFDYVKPSNQGTTWGFGGTCLNVGCVPKKLMHYSGLFGELTHYDAKSFGWNLSGSTFNWNSLVKNIQDHISGSSWSYKNGLRSAKVKYINALASFNGPNTLSYSLSDEKKIIKAKHILIATGGRPLIPSEIPGAKEYAITSDDLFSLKQAPGKTLVVGASYIALECAGFLTSLGFDVTVAVRSILLRGFDRQCAEKIGEIMSNMGTKFLSNQLPIRIEKNANTNKLTVIFTDGHSEQFETVLYATGRYPDIQGLQLENAGVLISKDEKLNTDDEERTNVPFIYAVGDVIKGRPELTPVALRTGELLARRLFGGSNKKMDWHLIPTAVFTPAEYGTVGYSEEEALAKFGEEDIEVYLTEFTTLEHSAAHREKHHTKRADEYDVFLPPTCLAKIICRKSDHERVIGFHFVGPNAGEITQGFAVAMRAGATKEHFNETIGIHPTDAESIVQLSVTRRSGKSWIAAEGCGGGKCG